jgi:D-alanyl-D-alanine carboxypeptidase
MLVRSFRGWTGFLIAAVFLTGGSTAAASFTAEQRAEMQQAVESWKRELHYPGLAAGLWQREAGGFETAVGVANRKSGRPLGVRDRFPIGSITKTMTATLVLQLVERRKLRLDDPVRRYVRRLPHGGQITIRELLNMTSGIHTYSSGLIQDFVEHPQRQWRPGEIVRRMVAKPRSCPAARSGRPSCWEYSDTNYLLLGMIIKRVTATPLPKLFERRIFGPLGMSQTIFAPRRDRLPTPHAHGYIRDKQTGRALDVTDSNLSYAWTAGAAVSTLRDLRRWGPALATGRGVLGKRMQRKRLQFVPIPHESGDGYGLGLFRLPGGPFGGLIGHDGQPLGYDSFLLYAPHSRVAIAALGNTSVSAGPLRRSPLDRQPMEQLGAGLLEALGVPAPTG